MKVYAARYTECKYEYGPSVISLHKTPDGAQNAIFRSQAASRESFRQMQEWLRQEAEEGRGYYPDNEEWSFENGDGFEKWMITEMEVEE